MAEACWLECPSCGDRREIGAHFFGCARCRDASGHPMWWEVAYDRERIDPREVARGRRLSDFASLLPVGGDLWSLGEGGTPLLRIESLNARVGLPDLWLKWEAPNPTGSFKDRLHAV